MRLIRCLLYGFFQFGGPEPSAGRAIGQSFDRCQERKFLLAHENNSAQQKGFRESENKFAMLKKFIWAKLRAL